ncbi:MAG: ATP-dependent endonuclease, partial [Candidatus Hodarchaeota archaeon]
MKIKQLEVKNFRCIKESTLPCDDLTVLLGPNGSGKSSFLQALNLFYDSRVHVNEDDFYNRNLEEEIIIRVHFSNLTEVEKNLFRAYIDGENLVVEKVIIWPSGRGRQKYHGSRLKNPDFNNFRTTSGTDLRSSYNDLRKSTYSELPSYTNKENAEIALREWEESHPNECQRHRDDGQFFGFNEVGSARLEKFTKFILIPAVCDASENVAEGKGSPMSEIMELTVRRVLSQKAEWVNLESEMAQKLEEIVNPEKLEELGQLEDELNALLRTFAPNAGVELSWESTNLVNISPPRSQVKIIEDGFPSSVERTGHGVQRAFILTLLQYLATLQPLGDTEERDLLFKPDIIIGVEEPELYQHPNRQRLLSTIFLQLVKEKNNKGGGRTQIMYSTHSPLFVDIKRFNNIRLLNKTLLIETQPKQTNVIYTTLDEIARSLEKIEAKPDGFYTSLSLTAKLQTLMTPWINEGFFADIAILVEGEEDRAAVIGTANELKYDLESWGISVIPCSGKGNLHKAAVIFQKLGIPIYVIWDSDFKPKKGNPEENKRLLRLFDQPEEDWPENITGKFACFKRSLTQTFRYEIGKDLHKSILNRLTDEFSITKKKAMKNPVIIQRIITEARKNGKSCV